MFTERDMYRSLEIRAIVNFWMLHKFTQNSSCQIAFFYLKRMFSKISWNLLLFHTIGISSFYAIHLKLSQKIHSYCKSSQMYLQPSIFIFPLCQLRFWTLCVYTLYVFRVCCCIWMQMLTLWALASFLKAHPYISRR